MAGSDGPPRALLIAALVLGVTAICVVLAIASTRRGAPQPTAVGVLPAPRAQDPTCQALLAVLPRRLGDYERVDSRPEPAGSAVWRNGGGTVDLHCGLDRPADFVLGSPIQVVDRVQWFDERDAGSDGATARSTWYAVDRSVYVALVLPPGSGPTPIQQLSEVIDRTIPPVPINPARPPG